jgi:hypothetical protein
VGWETDDKVEKLRVCVTQTVAQIRCVGTLLKRAEERKWLRGTADF